MLGRPLLFLSSYAPLFGLLAIRFEQLWLWISCTVLAALGVVCLWLLLRLDARSSPGPHTLASVRDAGVEAAGYLAAYLLPFLTVATPTGSSVWILNQKNFEGLFKESEAVLARTSEWVNQLSQVLPIADDGQEWLATRLRQNSVMRRKVHNILRSHYLSKLTPDILRARMSAHGLIPEDLMKDGALIFNGDTEKDLLLFLNEDLWTGDFSGDQYAAARKARR